MTILYRDHLIESDRGVIENILESTTMFTHEQLCVALGMVDENLIQGNISGYHFLLAEDDKGNILGYTCFGPFACIPNSYDLYWIAVRNVLQDKGIGKNLVKKTQRVIAKLGGDRIYIETSSRATYAPTREFYLRAGFRKEEVFEDFYSSGDDKIVYFKRLPLEKST